MKKFSATGFTVVSVLGIALLGGAAGGALVMSSGDEPAQPRPVEVGLKVADEVGADPMAEPSPVPSPASTMDPTAPGVPAAAAGSQEGDVAPKTESAKEAADRAAREADRAEEAAQRAEDAAAEPKPSPAPTQAAPVPPTPKPTPAPECTDGMTMQYIDAEAWAAGYGPGWTPGEKVCRDGKWVKVKEPSPPASPRPSAAPTSAP